MAMWIHNATNAANKKYHKLEYPLWYYYTYITLYFKTLGNYENLVFTVKLPRFVWLLVSLFLLVHDEGFVTPNSSQHHLFLVNSVKSQPTQSKRSVKSSKLQNVLHVQYSK